VPGILEDMHEQYLLPPLHAGWSVRRKSNHFQSYEEVSKRFGKLMGIDPWLINPMFNKCGEVDFPMAAAANAGHQCRCTADQASARNTRNTASTKSRSWSSRRTTATRHGHS
jgi:glutamate--cysteine ligase